MRLPIQRICTAGDYTILASEKWLSVLDRFDALVSVSAEGSNHTAIIKLLLVDKSGRTLVSIGDDKQLKVWDLPTLALRSTRGLVKRATAISFSADERNIIVADKFGDVYSFQVDAPETSAAGASKQQIPLLGHVSLLTAVCLTADGTKVITADRDEHVRVSRYPESWDIVAFLGGHKRFVSALCLLGNDHLLLSAGGDDDLFIWDLEKSQLIRKLSVTRFLDGIQVSVPRPDALARKLKYQQSKINGADTPVNEIDQPDFSPLVVNKALLSPTGSLMVLTAAGSSIVLYFACEEQALRDEMAQVKLGWLDAPGPVLDICWTTPTQLLVSCDRCRGINHSAVPQLVRAHLEDGKLEFEEHVWEPKDAFRTADESSPIPNDELLYGELSYLVKDPAELAGRQSQVQDPTS